MTRRLPPSSAERPPRPASGGARDRRLKAALKANLGRRKAQARAREGADADGAAGPEAPDAPPPDSLETAAPGAGDVAGAPPHATPRHSD